VTSALRQRVVQRKPYSDVFHRSSLPTAQRLGQSLVLLGHVHPALWIQVSHQEFYCSTERVIPILYAVLFKRPQHAIDIGCASDIHGIFGQFIHGGEIACEPVSVGEVKTIAPCLEKGLTRF
jgi:hypothetical protein